MYICHLGVDSEAVQLRRLAKKCAAHPFGKNECVFIIRCLGCLKGMDVLVELACTSLRFVLQ